MVKLEVTEKQAYVIMDALDLYSRIGIGQFDRIKDHPTIHNHIWNNHREEYHNFADDELLAVRNKLFDLSYGLNGSHGIHSSLVDDSNRVAFDIKQVIRHEFWKNNPDRSDMTVDSHVHFTSKDGESHKIKCEMDKNNNLDDDSTGIYCKICSSCGEEGCCIPTICENHKDGLYCESNLLALKIAYCTLEDFYNWLYENKDANKGIIDKLHEIEDKVEAEFNR